MKDGKVYSVVLDGVTKEFTATDNTVASLTVDPVTIPYGVETEINMIAKDANGVELVSSPFGTAVNGYDFTIETTSGYTSGSKLYLTQKGDTATAKVTYHSGKYDENGNEIGNIESGAITITAVDPEAVTVNNFSVRFGDAGKSYDELQDGAKVAVGDTKTAYFKIVNSKNEEIADSDYGTYTVETSNKDVLLLDSNVLTSKAVAISPVAVGTAYIVVKNADGNVVAAVPVTIVAERKATSLVLDATSFTLSNATAQADKDVKVTLKDQYGDDMAAVAAADITVECVTASGNGAADKATATGYATPGEGKVTFVGNGNTAGTYTYTIKVGNLTKTVVVTIKEPNGTVSYSLDLSATSMDAVVNSADDENKTISIKVARLEGGVLSSYDDSATITVTKDGKEVSEYSANTLTVTSSNGTNVSKLAAGTYQVKAVVAGAAANGGDVTLTKSITITDTQAAVTASRIADSTASSSDDAATIAGNCYKYTYNGKVYTNNSTVANVAGAVTVTEVETTATGTGVYFRTVTIQIPAYEGGSNITVKVNVGNTVTYSN